MKKQEIIEAIKKTAKNIKGELMAVQAIEITNTAFAIIRTSRGKYSVYYYDQLLNHSLPFPIRTFGHYNEAMAVFSMLRYDGETYQEYPF